MPSNSRDVELRGRRQERATLDRLLDDVRAGHSRALVLRGEAGAGKTALLDYSAGHASGLRVLRAAGVESEAEITYSALQYLSGPLLPYLDRLPEVQRDALSIACALRIGEPPEPLVVGMALLGLLSEAAADRPLLCLVDDVQWLDRHSGLILTFVARRLAEESVGLIFAARGPGEGDLGRELPELTVRGLSDADARALLDSVLPGPVDARVRDRIVAETRGNPLALLELPKGLSPAELAFGFGGRSRMPLASRVEQGFARRIAALPADARTFLLAAAVEPVGDVPLLWRALRWLGIGPEVVGPAEAEGLIEVGAQVRFRHPLVRSAAWRSADAPSLREVHAALAEAIDPVRDPDRRAWHRAYAAIGPEEEVAGELERSADRAVARGGRSAAASFLERAVALTADPGRRSRRALAAAHARLEAGPPTQVPDLIAVAEMGPLDSLQRADAAALRAQVMFASNPGRGAGPRLLEAAAQLAELNPDEARHTYLAALGAAMWTGRLGDDDEMARAAEAARSLPPSDDVPGLFLTGLIAWTLEGPGPAAPLFSQALQKLSGSEDLTMLWLAAPVSMELGDNFGWLAFADKVAKFARETGTPTLLQGALAFRAGAMIYSGRLADAAVVHEEAVATAQALGMEETSLGAGSLLVAHQGRERPALEEIERLERLATGSGLGRHLGVAAYARAVLYNGLGKYSVALAAARRAVEFPDMAMYDWSLVELVEAATRCGEPGAATDARDRLFSWTRDFGTPWALGVQALADALAGPDEPADDRYRDAVAQFARADMGMLAARARLLYGEWLRTENRRADARVQLRAAYEAFLSNGAEAFADRAGRELTASGETVHRRAPGDQGGLTAQETQIARLAAAGRSNGEIGAAMFLSPRTVEWHLRKIYSKCGITSRRELAGALEVTR